MSATNPPVPWPPTTPAPKKSSMFDDVVAAATQFTRFEENRSMKVDSNVEAAKAVAAQINAKLPAGGLPRTFRLSGPAQLTIKTRQGQFKKKAFMGDEEMRLTTTYGGVRDGVICVFKNAVPVEYATIEIPMSEAREILIGFAQVMDSWDVPELDNIVNGIEQNIAQAAAVEREQALAESPEFGSW
jgi:hypothetical protein